MARILIIDDNEEIRLLLHRVLETDHEVMDAADGADGLKLLSGQKVDLVITDIFMPDMDGLELLREMRKSHSGMKVIAISGGGEFGNMDVMRIARSFGAFHVMAKPFSLSEMLQTVSAALSKSNPG